MSGAAEGERKAIRLDIIGNDRIDPAHTAELKDAIRARGLEDHTSLRGRVKLQDLIGFYREASVFVHPSHYEGWGIVVQEAASFALPLVVSDGGSLPEVVEDGRYGVVFPVGDHAALTGELDRLFRDTARRADLSAKAAELYRTSMTWEGCNRLVEEYVARMNGKGLSGERT